MKFVNRETELRTLDTLVTAAEVDVAAINRTDGHVLLGECKWERAPMNPCGV